MLMNQHLLQFFNAQSGAGSIVTTREATGDKSVTVDQDEKSVLFQLYDANSFTRAGGAKPDANPTHKEFNVYTQHNGAYDKHKLAIKYPKATKNELRLYFNRDSDFYPNDDCFWFVFVRDDIDVPFIGYMPSTEWENIASGEAERLAFENSYALDEDDDLYQKQLHSPQAQKGTITSSTTKYQRDPTLAAKAIREAKHACQFDNSHESFVSAASMKRYVEAHHLIPISQSPEYKNSLDVRANLVILCPNCHRAIHFGTPEVKKIYLDKFFAERQKVLEDSGIATTIDDLYAMYKI